MSKYDLFPLGLLAIVVIIASTIASISCSFIDARMWNVAIRHADELVIESDKVYDSGLYTLYLKDTAGNTLYEVLVNDKDKSCCVFSGKTIIASSANFHKSRKMYKRIEHKLPPERKNKLNCLSKKDKMKLIRKKIEEK